MIATADFRFQEKLKKWSNYLVAIVLIIALLALTGWQFNVRYLIHPLAKLPPMNPLTAVAFVLFSLAFFLLNRKNNSQPGQRAGQAFALIVLLIGAIKFSELLFRYDSKIDSLLFPDKIFIETPVVLYAHMSPVAAICFLLAGLSLLLLNYETRRRKMPSHFMALIIAYFGLASLMGYIFTVKAFYGNLTYVTMAIHTGVSFIFISIAILFATPDRGMMKELTNPFAGSIVARRLIPIAVLIPVILGLIRLYLQLNGIVTYEIGITFVIMCVIMSLLGFIFYVTKLLNNRDYERREAEEELTETNYFLNTVLENIPDMIFVKDARELRFFRYNKAGEILLGYSKNELIGKNDYDFFPKEQADFFIMKDREALMTDSLVDIPEEPIMTKNGERWLHTKKIPVRDENGNPIYLVGISEDITERRKVDERLRQLNTELEKTVAERTAGEQMFSSLFYKSPVMKAILEESTGKHVDVNSEFADFMEFDRNEIIGKTAIELNLFAHPEEREGMMGTLRKNGFIRGRESQVNSRTGKIKWVSKSIDRITLNGKECYLTASVDITERKLAEEKLLKLSEELEQKVLERTEELEKSEQRFRKLLENNFESITLADEKFIPFYRSPAADRITGWTLEERTNSGGPVDFTHPDDSEKQKKIIREVIANPGKPVAITFRSRHKDGHYIWLEGFMTNMLHDESLNGIVANLRDVTDRRKAEDEINKLTGELRMLLEHVQTSREEERKYIAREIHDELGQRLTALKIDMSMMRKKIPAHESQLYFTGEINSVINQIDQAIESVKRIATDLRPDILDHHGVIAAVKWQAQQFENITGVQCKLSHLPEEINLEKELSTSVYRIVQEALTNIARHAKASSVSILIELDSEKLLLEIKDNGKGIHEDQITSMKSLGLIGIRERVHLLQGTLSISGKSEKGTVVSVNIPIKQT